MKLKISLLIGISLLFMGCNAIPEPIYEPQPLVDLEERKVKLQTHWLDSVGIGDMWRGYNLRPAFKEDKLITADVEGWVRAFDVPKKRNLWNFQASSGVSSPLVLADDRVYLATQNGSVVALNAKTGLVIWEKDLNREVIAISEPNDEILVLSTSDNKIIALETETGIKKWEYVAQVAKLTLAGAGTPLVTNVMTYAPMANGKLVGLDNETGDIRFISNIATPRGESPMQNLIDVDVDVQMFSGLVLVAGFNDALVAVNAFSGQKVWEHKISTYITPLIENKTLYLIDEKSQIIALDFRSGTQLWQQNQLYGRGLVAPVFLGKYIAVADEFGYVHMLEKNSGAIVGRIHFAKQGVIAPLMSNDEYLVAIGRRGKIGVFSINPWNW